MGRGAGSEGTGEAISSPRAAHAARAARNGSEERREAEHEVHVQYVARGGQCEHQPAGLEGMGSYGRACEQGGEGSEGAREVDASASMEDAMGVEDGDFENEGRRQAGAGEELSDVIRI